MRNLPFSTANAKALSYAITIQRGIETIRITSYHESLLIGGSVYSPVGGVTLSNMQFPSDGSASTCDIQVFVTAAGPIKPGDAARGALDGWPISVEMFSLSDIGAGTIDLFPNATIADVSENADGAVTLSINGQLARAKGPVTEHFALVGREELGDDRCKIPILPAEVARAQTFVRPDIATGLLHVDDAYGRVATGGTGTVEDYANVYYECTTAGTTDATTAPSYSTTVGASVTDGTAVFIVRDAWMRHARGQRTGAFTLQLTALPDSRATDDTWYLLGGLYFRSGPLAGFSKRTIRAWDHVTLTVTLFEPIGVNDVPANTQIELHAGCDLTPAQCFSRFNNITNIRAENFVPPSNNIAAL